MNSLTREPCGGVSCYEVSESHIDCLGSVIERRCPGVKTRLMMSGAWAVERRSAPIDAGKRTILVPVDPKAIARPVVVASEAGWNSGVVRL